MSPARPCRPTQGLRQADQLQARGQAGDRTGKCALAWGVEAAAGWARAAGVGLHLSNGAGAGSGAGFQTWTAELAAALQSEAEEAEMS